MPREIEIQLLGGFSITADGAAHDNLPSKSRRGVSLMTYLILQRGKAVAIQRLARELWGARRSDNPENALKTLISRLRSLLNSISEGLGGAIQSEQGAYRWQNLPGVQVDVLEFIELAEELKKPVPEAVRWEKSRRVLALYQGDLFQNGDMVNGSMQASWLHKSYLETVYAYVEMLKERDEYNEIARVCDIALKHDELDEFLHIERMRAMVGLNRADEARQEYRLVSHRSRELLDAEPSDTLRESYQQLATASAELQFNLDAISNELMERDSQRSGPFFCDYSAFREIYNIQYRNLERLGSTMFLGVIMVAGQGRELSDIARESAMAGIQEILRNNLRKGDIVTRFSPVIYAMLLPTVDYGTGGMVMERIEHLFYQEYPGGSVTIQHRICPLGGRPAGNFKQIS